MAATMMIKLFSLSILVNLLANSKGVVSSSSTAEPTISASPGVLPYVTAPDISSFFPTPTANQPTSSAAPSKAEAPAPLPSSGEFEGKISGSARLLLDSAGAIAVGVVLLCVYVVPC